MTDFVGQLVQGFTWKARMSNGAVFEFWVSRNISRATAKQEILDIAEVYDASDIISIWKTRG